MSELGTSLGSLQSVYSRYGALIPSTRGVEMRREWKKFGDSAGDKPGPDVSTTVVVNEEVFLQFTQKTDLSEDKDSESTEAGSKSTAANNTSEEHSPDNLLAMTANLTSQMKTGKVLVCRYCKGNHFSMACKNKDLATLESSTSPITSALEAERLNKYIPPSVRKAMEASAAGIVPTPEARNNENSIRVTNLSEFITEQDLRTICNLFGPVDRVFIPKEELTGKSRGFAFVSYKERAVAEKALKRLNGHRLDQLIVHAEWAGAPKR